MRGKIIAVEKCFSKKGKPFFRVSYLSPGGETNRAVSFKDISEAIGKEIDFTIESGVMRFRDTQSPLPSSLELKNRAVALSYVKDIFLILLEKGEWTLEDIENCLPQLFNLAERVLHWLEGK